MRKMDRGGVMFVARIASLEPKNKLRLAKPCADCMKMLRRRGVLVVWYSLNDGGIECVRP